MDAHDRPRLLPLGPARSTEPVAADLVEVAAAVAMVRAGAAVRVRLVGLRDAAGIAGVALARAQAVGLAVRLDRDGSGVTLIIGPRT